MFFITNISIFFLIKIQEFSRIL